MTGIDPGAAGPRLARFAARSMGSRLSLTVLGAGRGPAEAAWSAVEAEFAAVDAALSRFRDDSELSALNRASGADVASGWTEVGRRSAGFLSGAWRAQRMTDGRFDVRVVEVLEALGEHGAAALAAPPVADRGARWLTRDGRACRFRVARPVDSGGLGKGLALRWATRAAGRAAPDAAGLLLDAGGDVVARGSGPVDGAWMIGIEDPAAGDEPIAVIAARDTAVATSSTRVRRWTGPDGRPVHHIIDPAAGAPASGGLLAVTVAMRDPAWAEVWTKALFVAGAGRIGPEARARGLAAWWIEEDGSLHLTPAARSVTAWVRSEARPSGARAIAAG